MAIGTGLGNWIGRAVALAVAAASSVAVAAPVEKPVAGQQVRFPKGYWSGLPQVGPDGKVRQCVLVALRQRSGSNGALDTRFALNIGRGAGLAFTIHDDGLPTEQVLDDQAEVLLDDRAFPAVGFPVGTAFVFHPGDAAGALAALGKATRVQLRSAGAGIDSGAIEIGLPAEALNWLKQCGKAFDIAIDRPSDPNAPDMPVPRPPSPQIAMIAATPAGPPGMADKQKIKGWDASELRDREGHIIVCYIRRRYVTGSEPSSRTLGTFHGEPRQGPDHDAEGFQPQAERRPGGRSDAEGRRNALHGFFRTGAGARRDRHFSAAQRGARRRAGEGRARHFQIAGERQFRISSTGRRDPLAARLRPPQRHRDRAGRAMTALVQ